MFAFVGMCGCLTVCMCELPVCIACMYAGVHSEVVFMCACVCMNMCASL